MSGFGLMIDATSSAIPGLLAALGSNNPQTYATYVTGSADIRATPAQLSELTGRAGLFTYDQSPDLQLFAEGQSDAADIEPGAGTVVAAVAAAIRREVKGWFSWFYLSESNLANARTAASDGHLAKVRFIVADWSFSQAEAETFLNANPDVDGVQWASPTSNPNTICPGTTRTLAQLNVDLNLVRAGWFTKQAATNPPTITKGLVVKSDLTSVAVTSTDGITWKG